MSGVSTKQQSARAPIAAEIFLKTLADHGVDYFFANPGTDFPPIVEAFTRARTSNAKFPKPLLVPHENLAVAMAHGAYLMTGRPQAVMVHVNVGTGNTVNNITNLSRDRAPLILCAGRTPFTEKGSFGSRSRSIHWAQEMFDQAGMLREMVKWDYELKVPEQIADVTARAYEMTMTSPRGPVYLVLPREPLSAPVSETLASAPRQLPAPGYPDPQAIVTLASWVAKAEQPLIITSSDGDPRAVAALSKLAERFALPVVNHNPRTVTLPASHPMHAGYDSGPLVPEADLIVNAECDVPWYPNLDKTRPGCKFAHIGEDTIYQRYPMRSFPSDLSITSRSASAFEALHAALEQHLPSMTAAIERRRKQAAERRRRETRKSRKRRVGPRTRLRRIISAPASARPSVPTP